MNLEPIVKRRLPSPDEVTLAGGRSLARTGNCASGRHSPAGARALRQSWEATQASADMTMIRVTDDIVAFEHEWMLGVAGNAMRDSLREFTVSLNPAKLIEWAGTSPSYHAPPSPERTSRY